MNISTVSCAAAVAGTLDEPDDRCAREPLQLREREDGRPIDHAVNQQRVLLRVDRWHATVMALEVEVGWRDDAIEILERSERRGPGRAEGHPRWLLERRTGADVAAGRSLHLRRVLVLC